MVENVNWISGREPPGLREGSEEGVEMLVKLRHGPTMTSATVRRVEGGEVRLYSLAVTLARRDKGLAPGQFAAFYSADESQSNAEGVRECLGAGTIALHVEVMLVTIAVSSPR